MSKVLSILIVIIMIQLVFINDGLSQTQLLIEGGYFIHNDTNYLVLHDAQFINNGTYNNTSGVLVMTGDSSDVHAAIGGDSLSTFYQLEINKTTNGAQLQQNIQIEQDLIMTSGTLDLNGDTLTLATYQGSIINESEQNRIIGPNGGLIQKSVNLNAPNGENPGNIGLSISSSQDLGYTLIQREHQPVSLNDTASITRCFRVIPTNNQDLAASIQIHYFDAELNQNDETELSPWRRDSAFWYNPVGSADTINNFVQIDSIDFFSQWTLAAGAPKIQLKGFLQAAYDFGTQQMEDDLRRLDLLPTSEPYTNLGFSHTGSGGDESIDSTILNTVSSSSMVDWVFVELRDATDSSNVIATRSGLITKSGDIVDLDGASPLSFPGSSSLDNRYYVALRHRNHLGVMSASPISISSDGNSTYDFTDRTLHTFERADHPQAAQYDNGVHTMMWAGDANGDRQIVYVGATDLTPISAAVFLNPLNNPGFDPTLPVSDVYDRADINMDGSIIYVGNTDITPISASVFLHPLNLGTFDPLFILYQQLPD